MRPHEALAAGGRPARAAPGGAEVCIHPNMLTAWYGVTLNALTAVVVLCQNLWNDDLKGGSRPPRFRKE